MYPSTPASCTPPSAPTSARPSGDSTCISAAIASAWSESSPPWLPLSFVCIGFFLWLAENIATYFGAWEYPEQQSGWQLVHLGKFGSWVLLVSLSFVLVTALYRCGRRRTGPAAA